MFDNIWCIIGTSHRKFLLQNCVIFIQLWLFLVVLLGKFNEVET